MPSVKHYFLFFFISVKQTSINAKGLNLPFPQPSHFYATFDPSNHFFPLDEAHQLLSSILSPFYLVPSLPTCISIETIHKQPQHENPLWQRFTNMRVEIFICLYDTLQEHLDVL
jgi:hypothetical protein